MVVEQLVSKDTVKEFRERVIKLHEDIIKLSGGCQGIRDIGGIEHALFEILKASEKYHKEFPFRAPAKAYLLLATRHYFIDGNKRTSHILARAILSAMGYGFKPKYAEAVNFIVDISQGKKTIDEIEEWVKCYSFKQDIKDEFMRDAENDLSNMKEYMDSHS